METKTTSAIDQAWMPGQPGEAEGDEDAHNDPQHPLEAPRDRLPNGHLHGEQGGQGGEDGDAVAEDVSGYEPGQPAARAVLPACRAGQPSQPSAPGRRLRRSGRSVREPVAQGGQRPVGHVEVAPPDPDAQVGLVGTVVVGASGDGQPGLRRHHRQFGPLLPAVAPVDGLQAGQAGVGQLPYGA